MRTLLLALALTLTLPAHAQDDPPESVDELRDREAEILERVRQLDPGKHAALLRLKQTDPRGYMAAMMKVGAHLRRAERAPPPELRAEMVKLQELRTRYPDGIDDLSKKERAAVRTEITDIAERIFDLKQQMRRERIAELKEALAELEEDVATRERERKDRIDKFVERVLIGEVDL